MMLPVSDGFSVAAEAGGLWRLGLVEAAYRTAAIMPL